MLWATAFIFLLTTVLVNGKGDSRAPKLSEDLLRYIPEEIKFTLEEKGKFAQYLYEQLCAEIIRKERERMLEKQRLREDFIYKRYLVSKIKGTSVLKDFHSLRY